MEGNSLENNGATGNPDTGNVPAKEEKSSAFHFFLYLVQFFSLFSVSAGVGTILYEIINKSFPSADVSILGEFSETLARSGVASLIIATPIFFGVSYLIAKYIFQGYITENSKIRKWTTYLVLFIAALTILGRLISIVFSWLDGSMLAPSLLKTLVTLCISSAIFGFYFWDMRKRDVKGRKYLGNKIAFSASLAVVLVVFGASFFFIDSPTEIKNKKADQNVINNLDDYKYSIRNYFNEKKSLPESLSQLTDGDSSAKKYGITYKKNSSYSYDLCASFKFSSIKDGEDNYAGEWDHEEGQKCFTLEVEPSEENSYSGDKSMEDSSSPSSVDLVQPVKEVVDVSSSQSYKSADKDRGVSIIMTLKDGSGKLLSGIPCDLETNSQDNRTMIVAGSVISDSSGNCNFENYDSSNPYIVRIYWTSDRSRNSVISLSFLNSGTRTYKTVVKP